LPAKLTRLDAAKIRFDLSLKTLIGFQNLYQQNQLPTTV
jgi:hypothetical protein